MPTQLRFAVVAVFTGVIIACGGSVRGAPASPSVAVPRRLVLALSGQSNAVSLKPILERYAVVVGEAWGGATIDQWDADRFHGLWYLLTLAFQGYTASQPFDAFVWWQGESDENVNVEAAVGLATAEPPGFYQERLERLIRNVRTETHQSALPVLIVELGPKQRGGAVTTETLAVVEHDPHARYVKTSDIPFIDGTHMDADGYDRVAQRILLMLP